MTHGKDPHPLPFANRTPPWVTHGKRESEWASEWVGGGWVCCVREREEKGGWGLWSKTGAKTKSVSFNIYSHTGSERGRNLKWVTVSQDSRKKKKERKRKQRAPERGEKEKLRESQRWTEASKRFTGLKRAATNLQWKGETKGVPDSLRNVLLRVRLRENNKWVLHDRVASCVTINWCEPATKLFILHHRGEHVSVSVFF